MSFLDSLTPPEHILTLLGGPRDGGTITDPEPREGMRRVLRDGSVYGPFRPGERVLRFERMADKDGDAWADGEYRRLLALWEGAR